MGNSFSSNPAGPGKAGNKSAQTNNYSSSARSASATPTSTTTSKEQNRLCPAVQLKKAGRAAIAAGLPAKAEGSGEETAELVARHLRPSAEAVAMGGDQIVQTRVILTTRPCATGAKEAIVLEGGPILHHPLLTLPSECKDVGAQK